MKKTNTAMRVLGKECNEPTVAAAHQVVGRMVRLALLHQQRQDVGLALAHAHVPRAGQIACLLSDALVALHPENALQNTGPGRVAPLEFARPRPGVDPPSGSRWGVTT